MTTTTVRRTVAKLADLENQICDLDRAARIAFLVTMHDAEERLGLFTIEQVERLASELRADFDRITSDGQS